MTRHPLLAAPRLVLPPLAGIAALAVAAAVFPTAARPLVINESQSLPRGVYVRTGQAVARGAIITAPPPPSARAYLDGLGAPRTLPLLKRVAALPGDKVCSDGLVVVVPFGVFTIQSRDRRGVALPAWRGCRALAPDELFLLGDAPNSFDSRYFGPVRRQRAHGVYRRLGA